MTLQNKILLGGVGAVLLLALVVPWQVNGRPAGYRPVFWGPDGTSHVDLTRLMIPIAAVVVATAVGMYLTRNRHTGAPSQPPPEQTPAPTNTSSTSQYGKEDIAIRQAEECSPPCDASAKTPLSEQVQKVFLPGTAGLTILVVCVGMLAAIGLSVAIAADWFPKKSPPQLDSNEISEHRLNAAMASLSGDHANAIRAYSELIRNDPKNCENYRRRASSFKNIKDYDNAIKDYDEVIRLEPNNPSNYSGRGDVWLDKKNYDKAIEDYSHALLLDPKLSTLYFNRGNTWLDKQEFDKAIKDYDEAIRLDPKYKYAFLNRGVAWCRKNASDEAILDFDDAIRLDPKYSLAFFNRGCSWRDKKNYQKAIKDFDEAIRLDPIDARGYRSLADLLSACPLEKIRKGECAIQLATKACELTDWSGVWELTILAQAYAESGQFDKAEMYQIKALEVPNSLQGDRVEFRKRLELYKQKKPYRAGS